MVFIKARMNKQDCYKEWKKLHKKIVKEKRHYDFLNDCKYFRIIPKFIKIHNYYLKHNFKREKLKFENDILRKTIKNKYNYIRILTERENKIIDDLGMLCNKQEMLYYTNKIQTFGEIENCIIADKQNRKLRFWLKSYNVDPYKKVIVNEIPYINLSSKTLNSHQDALIKLGPKYILDEPIHIKDTIPKIEKALEIVPSEKQTQLRSLIQEELSKKLKEKSKDYEDRKCLNELKNDESIACIMTDKTGKIAILDKSDYINKMGNTIKEINVDIMTQNSLRKLTEKVGVF